jgi:hypothetical protein
VGGLPGRVEVLDDYINDALVFQMPTPWVQDGVLGLSVFLYYTNTGFQPTVQHYSIAAVGLLNTNRSAFITRAYDWASLSGALVTSPGDVGHQLALRSIEGLTETGSLSPVLSLRWGWYELVTTFRLMAAHSLGYSVRLDWRGEDGMGLPLNLARLDGVARNMQLYAGGRVYFAFAGARRYGVLAFDNVFIEIPEPSALALLALGAGGLVLGRVRPWAHRGSPSWDPRERRGRL